ncbi:type VI secretion system baseplate subunit TssK [Candidatus Thiothrix sp. Deng01]|uniref:Type VI secretion system baseplate subunit TssK n=1 Tax=Candidatus Thiothrix phosphatis TaxID=3112415 RepID=A0ABU6CXZ0_9GAMM|nr:type VI secretion system baseplate subunit TssK [Candidatus Thiothrix sp. Deng01]MEB4591278.1 type VI secretion system baseplate subunit TssK [Candidatus Thiothrix sp. Deng01]
MDKDRVIWQEGLFLRPQHFQQQERFLLGWMEERCRVLRPYNWGFTALTLDAESLALGKLVVLACQGVFPDGTPFDAPNNTPAPPPLDVPADMKDCRIYLGLPLQRPGERDIRDDSTATALARYAIRDANVRDVYTQGMDDPAELQVGALQLSILTEKDNTRAFSLIPLARVVEKASDQGVKLEAAFIPTVLYCQASQRMAGFVREIQGLLKHRGDALAAHMAAPGAGGAAEVANFLQLQVINRYEPLFGHLDRLSALHPEDFYRLTLLLAGELATFTRQERRPPALPDYRHDDLDASFRPVMEEIRRAFSTVVEKKALRLEIVKHQYGVWVARIEDKTLLTAASFVLASKADLAPEKLRQTFPRQTTVSTVEKIANLVNAHLPGIELYPMQVAPPQIPYHVGFTYFEIDTRDAAWKQLESSGGLAVHIGAAYPGLELELWAIRP